MGIIVINKLVLLAKDNQNDEVKNDEMVRPLARMGRKRNSYRILVGKPEGKRPLRRQRRRWEDNIKIDLREI
jgi:hypothetical protein